MVNRVILIGNVGKDPETFNFAGGGKVVSFSIATSENWRDQAGERQSRTEWHEVKIFHDQLGSIAEQYVKKGSKLYLEGQIESRKYTDSSGVNRTATEIVLRWNASLEMLDRKPNDAPQQDEASRPGARQRRGAQAEPRR